MRPQAHAEGRATAPSTVGAPGCLPRKAALATGQPLTGQNDARRVPTFGYGDLDLVELDEQTPRSPRAAKGGHQAVGPSPSPAAAPAHGRGRRLPGRHSRTRRDDAPRCYYYEEAPYHFNGLDDAGYDDLWARPT